MKSIRFEIKISFDTARLPIDVKSGGLALPASQHQVFHLPPEETCVGSKWGLLSSIHQKTHRFNHKRGDKIQTSVYTASDWNKDMGFLCENLQIHVKTEPFTLIAPILT